MRLNTKMRRLVAGISLVAVLGGGLLLAERASSPVVIGTKSIALNKTLPKLPTSPLLTTTSPLLAGLKSNATPQATASPSAVTSQFFPVNGPICAALLIRA